MCTLYSSSSNYEFGARTRLGRLKKGSFISVYSVVMNLFTYLLRAIKPYHDITTTNLTTILT